MTIAVPNLTNQECQLDRAFVLSKNVLNRAGEIETNYTFTYF